jgi:hypothetical protein
MQKSGRWWLAGLAVLLVGCGLTDYEQQMAKTRARLAWLAQEDALLAGPVEWPTGLPRLFFRPPVGVATAPSGGTVPAGEWLHHFPAAERGAALPPVELFLGVLPRSERKLESRITDYVRAHADWIPSTQDVDGPREETFVRPCDIPELRVPVRIRRFGLTTEELPQWPAPERVSLPRRVVYQYEVNIHDTGEWFVVVIFKRFDRPATEDAWARHGLEPDPRFPTVDVKKLAEQRRYSLAMLRVGPAAEARFRLMGRN